MSHGGPGGAGGSTVVGEGVVETGLPSNGVAEVIRNVLRGLGAEFEDSILFANLEAIELADEDVKQVLAALRFRGELQEVRPGRWRYTGA